MGYRVLILRESNSKIEGKPVLEIHVDLIDEALVEIERVAGHQIGYGKILLIQILRED